MEHRIARAVFRPVWLVRWLEVPLLAREPKVKDKANAVKENIKDMPTQTAYAVYSAKEKAKSSVSDFKRVFRVEINRATTF